MRIASFPIQPACGGKFSILISSFLLPGCVEKLCGCLATFHWVNCFCDPWNVRGNASFSLAVPRVWRPRPLSSAPEHTRTQTGTHKDTRRRIWTRRQMPARAHARPPVLCKRKAIRHMRGTSRPFYSIDIPTPRRDITTIRDPFQLCHHNASHITPHTSAFREIKRSTFSFLITFSHLFLYRLQLYVVILN